MKNIMLLFLVLSIPAAGQKKIKTIVISDTIVSAYIDRVGELYLLTGQGQLQRYDADGNLQVLYKGRVLPTLFDPRDGARLFAYYRPSQHYEYLTPSFEVGKAYRIDSSFVIDPWLICPSGEHKLWVLDVADHSLKKINPRDAEVEIEVTIDSTVISDARVFHAMREYQGFVFLYDPAKGILVLNGIGKHIKTIPVKGLKSFHFLGEELYFVQDGKIRFFDLFSGEAREVVSPVKDGDVLLTDIRLFHVLPLKVDIYDYTP
jgi:hypothetical protein